MPVDYDYAVNRHTLESPRTVIPILFNGRKPRSLLDVGCGIGTWLSAARQFGIEDIRGVDGVEISSTDLLVPRELFRVVDLSKPWTLDRKFDVALCLEVAEHLDERHSRLLIETLTAHSDEIVFSAACPRQRGQHHVNCQWPAYWQELFNACGFTCSDAIRWKIWNETDVDVWYRQNMFVARRDTLGAGREERLRAVVHPEFLEHLVFAGAASASIDKMKSLEDGSMPLGWYAVSGLKALTAKVRRRFLPA